MQQSCVSSSWRGKRAWSVTLSHRRTRGSLRESSRLRTASPAWPLGLPSTCTTLSATPRTWARAWPSPWSTSGSSTRCLTGVSSVSADQGGREAKIFLANSWRQKSTGIKTRKKLKVYSSAPWLTWPSSILKLPVWVTRIVRLIIKGGNVRS